MKQLSFPATRKSQDGAVAVEAAVCIALVLVPLLAFILFFGKFYWYYTAGQKAVHDAALYLATAPIGEIRNLSAEGLANDILAQETADFDPTTTTEPSVDCGYPRGASQTVYRQCTSTGTPTSVQTTINLTISDPFLGPIISATTGNDSITILIVSQMPYVGR